MSERHDMRRKVVVVSEPLTPERLAELRRIAEEATPGPWEITDPHTVLTLLDEIERLRREREVLVEALMPARGALADLDQSYYRVARQRVARQDPTGYVMGSVSVASLVTVIESTRKALALLDGEKGGDADG